MDKCNTLFGHVLSKANPNQAQMFAAFRDPRNATPNEFPNLAARLRGLKSDFEDGFLDDIWSIIRSEVADDYLSQAETLLRDGSYVPAIVLAGAVLEDALRKLAENNSIALKTEKGRPKTINPLNTDLKGKEVYSESKAKEITFWASLRNAVAHGEPEGVDPKAAKPMLEGVRAFLATYLQ